MGQLYNHIQWVRENVDSTEIPRDAADSSTQLMVGTASMVFVPIQSREQAVLLQPHAPVVRLARNRTPEDFGGEVVTEYV